MTRYTLPFFMCCLLSFTGIRAQNTRFQLTFGNIASRQQIRSMAPVENNLYTAGVLKNGGLQPLTAFYGTLNKTDLQGNVAWSKVYLPTSAQNMDAFFINSVIQSDAASITCLGNFLSTPESSGYYLFQTDLSGNVSWAYFLQDPNPEEYIRLVRHTSGDFYAILEGKIARFSSTGELLNAISFTSSNYSDFRDIAVTPEGNLLAIGNTLIQNQSPVVVARFSPDLQVLGGNLLYTPGYMSTAEKVLPLPEGGYMLLTYSEIIRIAANGTVAWAKSVYDPEMTAAWLEQLKGITPLDDASGDLLVTARGVQLNNSDFVPFIYTFRLSPDGVISAIRKTDEAPFQGINMLYPNDLCLNEDWFYLAGYLTNPSSQAGNIHINYLQAGHLSELSCVEENSSFHQEDISNCTLTNLPDIFSVPSGLQLQAADFNIFGITNDLQTLQCSELGLSDPEAPELSIYPNPASSSVTIHIADAIISSMFITDPSGRIIRPALANSNNLDVSAYASGMYFLTVITTDGRTATSSLLIE